MRDLNKAWTERDFFRKYTLEELLPNIDKEIISNSTMSQNAMKDSESNNDKNNKNDSRNVILKEIKISSVVLLSANVLLIYRCDVARWMILRINTPSVAGLRKKIFIKKKAIQITK